MILWSARWLIPLKIEINRSMLVNLGFQAIRNGDSDIVVGDPSFDSNAGEAYVLLNRTVD